MPTLPPTTLFKQTQSLMRSGVVTTAPVVYFTMMNGAASLLYSGFTPFNALALGVSVAATPLYFSNILTGGDVNRLPSARTNLIVASNLALTRAVVGASQTALLGHETYSLQQARAQYGQSYAGDLLTAFTVGAGLATAAFAQITRKAWQQRRQAYALKAGL